MATAEQIKTLLRSHVERDDQRFYSTALQVAAQEARQGHHKLASDIKEMIEKSQKNNLELAKNKPIPLLQQPKGDLNGLLDLVHKTVRINELVLSEQVLERLNKVLLEQKQKDRLAQFDLHPRRKLLFTGSPGTGKTMSAVVLATELKLPLYTIVLDSLITRFMGETASKLRLVFDHIKQTRAVYLFDEFDAIGTQRGSQNDVGEIRRVLNSFLLFVEQDSSESIIIAATNHPELLDKALYRRFDDIIEFEKPNNNQIRKIIENCLLLFEYKNLSWSKISSAAIGLSAAELTQVCKDAAKEAVLHYDNKISTDLILKAIKQRQNGKE
ncbi:AAA family ATPase [Agitococcus lubricus]|uniref:ATPase family protein associated with various cellular activities (AAA) n=1 Tax=Agitococcus lubricus TaxID=1077255 RepID=A0A2T5ISJ2_9GAMM|nr:ATP-binding protein [Agitococcus lubricus]PTQ86802.1 ATPase family protein associated with various cellular activities (AAA) [Agitococcus lubricus]